MWWINYKLQLHWKDNIGLGSTFNWEVERSNAAQIIESVHLPDSVTVLFLIKGLKNPCQATQQKKSGIVNHTYPIYPYKDGHIDCQSLFR